jgi:hypothetical protein
LGQWRGCELRLVSVVVPSQSRENQGHPIPVDTQVLVSLAAGA